MADPVPLNPHAHRSLRVVTGHGAAFGDSVNQTMVFPTEFEALQREYPIIFRQDANGGYRATVLLGLDRDENLYLDGDRWDARYVPALHARGPFSIGMANDGTASVLFDPDHPRLDSSGEPIFEPDGSASPLLSRTLDALALVGEAAGQTERLAAALAEAGLLASVALQLDLDETRRYTVPDCFTVDAERLAWLGGDRLDALHRAGHLKLAIWAASSLGNIPGLIARKNRRLADIG